MKLKIVLITFIFLFSSKLAFACPFCKDALAKMGQIWTSIGFNLSIYLLIAVPFFLVGSFSLVLYLFAKKHKPL